MCVCSFMNEGASLTSLAFQLFEPLQVSLIYASRKIPIGSSCPHGHDKASRLARPHIISKLIGSLDNNRGTHDVASQGNLIPYMTNDALDTPSAACLADAVHCARVMEIHSDRLSIPQLANQV